MKRVIAKFWMWVLPSFESDGSASARKLTAFTVLILIVAAHLSWLKNAFLHSGFELLPEILMIDFGFIATCLGMTTWEAVQRKKIDSNTTVGSTNPPTPPSPGPTIVA